MQIFQMAEVFKTIFIYFLTERFFVYYYVIVSLGSVYNADLGHVTLC